MARDDWRALGARTEQRLIRTLDVASILLLDSIILVFVYALLWGVDQATSGHNEYFEAVKSISHGTVFLLYLAWAAWDIYYFLRDSVKNHA